MLKLSFAFLLLLSGAAMAVPAGVVLPTGDDWDQPRLDKTVRAALEKAGVTLLPKVQADALILTAPGGIVRHNGDETATYNFTLAFFWHGEKLGESEQSCLVNKLSICSDQIVLDVQSALAASR